MVCGLFAWRGSPFTEYSPTLIMSAAFGVCLVIGVPIAYSMLFAAFLAGWSDGLLPITGVVNNTIQGVSPFVIVAIPFFLTTGYLMNSGGLAERLIDFASALVGHYRAGLAQANVFHSLMLGGVCGSASADAASTTRFWCRR